MSNSNQLGPEQRAQSDVKNGLGMAQQGKMSSAKYQKYVAEYNHLHNQKNTDT